ncbi:hypothetical protein JCGZ_22584 [Jatropha curcas]|uniref:Uncharacterized protein n=2 Tax=Jatropha curcas TaxID=180498 RepID=A0A067JZS5_JATCU|nr:hypothetical protein JCGZ_22584 [Jatropha curcas]
MAFIHYSKFPTFACSLKPKKPHFSAARAHSIPARDRVVDFGKYKGKMLGALPSTYLKWVSKNLRAGDFESWAKLADQVLEDPVYQDRLEWEFADGVLNGNKDASLSRNESAVSQLLEISERFGWDNEDKVGWSKINYELLGTSKGGRIPRLVSSCSTSVINKTKDPRADKIKKDQILSEREIRRKERRERAKLKSREEIKKDKLGILTNSKDMFVNGLNDDGAIRKKTEQEINNPFPGREALLKKALDGKRFL